MELDAGIAERRAPPGDSSGDAQFRLLVENVSDYAIFLLDRSGRVASWNPGAERIKGYAAGDIVGRHFSVFYTPEDRAVGKPEAILRRAEAEGRVSDQGWRQCRDGSRFWADVIVTALRSRDGRLSGFAKITRDMTDTRVSEAALRAAASELQALTRRLVEAEEAERRRIAMELHDRVGQNLSALNINLDIALNALPERSPAELGARLHDSLKLVDATLSCIENVMAELRPPLIEEYGLGAALRWHGEAFQKRTGIGFELEDNAHEHGAPREAAIALFRIAQEALSNVAKHAQASRVRIGLAAADDLVLTITDDGRGFEPAAAPAGRWGMTTMRERALAVGGRLEIVSRPGQGTRLTARIPLA